MKTHMTRGSPQGVKPDRQTSKVTDLPQISPAPPVLFDYEKIRRRDGEEVTRIRLNLTAGYSTVGWLIAILLN